LNFDSIEKNFSSFKGERDGAVAIGSYDPNAIKSKEKQSHTVFYELTIHIKEPVMELAPGEDGLPDEKGKKHAHECKNRVLSAIAKHGSVLYVANYFWFNQFIIFTYIQENHANAMAVELNKIMDEFPVRCHLATGLRNDPNWEAMDFFKQK